MNLETINKANGLLGDATELIHVLVKLIDISEIDKGTARTLTAVAAIALEKIEAANEAIDPGPAKAG